MVTTSRTTPTGKAKKPTAHFDIAQAEAEVDDELEEIEPYKVRAANGTMVTFTDPRKLDVFVAATLDFRDPFTAFRSIIEDPEEYAAFVEKGFTQITAKNLLNDYREHYKVLDLGN